MSRPVPLTDEQIAMEKLQLSNRFQGLTIEELNRALGKLQGENAEIIKENAELRAALTRELEAKDAVPKGETIEVAG